jgi:hypothetical protein
VIGAAPLLTPALPFTAENGFLKETINSATAPFQHSNEYFKKNVIKQFYNGIKQHKTTNLN